MIRSYGTGTTELGVWLGLIFGLGGIAGTLLGGYLAVRWFDGDERGQARMNAIAIGCLVPFYGLFLFLPGKQLALIAFIPVVVLLNFCLGPTFAVMQRLVSDRMRATTLAVVWLLANLIGMGLGPQVVGILSDWLTPALRTDSLRYAMLIVSVLAWWSAYHFWRAGRTVKEDLQNI